MPTGLFGKFIMAQVFDRGNVFLNDLVYQLLSIQEDDHVLEIGFGTGKLIKRMAKQVNKGQIEGVDFSNTMVSMASKKNKKDIANGTVKIHEGDFLEIPFEQKRFSKVCSVNTLYFWTDVEQTIRKIMAILKPGGKFLLAFENKEQLEKRKLSDRVFQLYSTDEIKEFLIRGGFSENVRIESRKNRKSIFHCVVAEKI